MVGTKQCSVVTLRSYSEFRRVFDTKARFFRNGLGFCYRRANNILFRFGISIPKRFGKAVERNKLRRRIKEIIRHSSSVPCNSEIVFCVRKPCSEFSYECLKNICEWGFNKISHTKISVEVVSSDEL